MNSGQIAENLFGAIDTIIDKKLREAKYDSTISAKIIKVLDSNLGRYEVQYQDAKFTVLSVGGGAYQVNDYVYILVPTNDFSRDKYILGLSNNNRRMTALGDVVTTAQLQAIINRVEELENQPEIEQIVVDGILSTNSSNPIANSAVASKINDIDKEIIALKEAGVSVDLTDYYKKAEVDAKIPNLAGYATESWVENKGYITADDIPEAENIPTKTSDLTNDSGFITQSALTGYALESQIPKNTSELTNNSGFITSSALTSYAKKSDIPDVPENLSDLTNDSGFITGDDLENYVETATLEDYATKSWIKDQGYKTTDNNTTYTIGWDDTNKRLKLSPSTGNAQYQNIKYATNAGDAERASIASTASKLEVSAGSVTQPIYFSDGVPVATTYKLNATVPAGAKFTDTTYTLGTDYDNITLTPLGGTSQTITVPYATKAGSAESANTANNATSLGGRVANDYALKSSLDGYVTDGGLNTALTNYVLLTNVKSKGSTTQPVYFNSNGVPTAIEYTIAKSVPSDAVFTDNKVLQYETTATSYRPVLLHSNIEDKVADQQVGNVYYNKTLGFNPSTGTLKATKFVGDLNGTATNSTQLNGQAASYYAKASDLTGFQNTISQVSGVAESAKTMATNAQEAADTAQQTATEAKTVANEVKEGLTHKANASDLWNYLPLANLKNANSSFSGKSAAISTSATSQIYPVALDSENKLSVYIPWANDKVTTATTTSKYYLTGQTNTSGGTGSLVFRTSSYVDSDGCLYSNGTKVLTSHQQVANSGPTLAWNTTSTIGTIGGTNLTVTMPANPNTDESVKTSAMNSSTTYYLTGQNDQNEGGHSLYYDTKAYVKNGVLYSNGQKVVTSNATQSASGLMSSGDKKRIENITLAIAASGSNNITLSDGTSNIGSEITVPFAQKAQKDGVGNIITSTYATKNELPSNANRQSAGLIRSDYDGNDEPSGMYKAYVYDGYVYYTNTTYNNASTSARGLMTATDKTKLDNLPIIIMTYNYGVLNIEYSTN